jgi:RNA polymerase sigma-70 factor (ECF subfamily)
LAVEAATASELDLEHRLVAEAQRGHLDAMRPLLQRHAPPLYATVILPRTGDAAVAEDVLRDTLATAVEKIGTFQWQGKGLYPWLRQIAINKCFDTHRAARRRQRLADALAQDAREGTDAETAADALLIADQERRAQRLRIDAALAALPERYRAAVTLRLVDELPREACAARLGVSVGTFDVLLFRAVRAFRKAYGGRDTPDDRDALDALDALDAPAAGPTPGRSPAR